MDLPLQLMALASAISYAASAIAARLGMNYSTPATMTCISFMTQTVVLWIIVFSTGGIPEVSSLAILLFLVVGFLMPIIRLLTYIGIARIGSARSSSLRSTYPLFSALIAVTLLHEKANRAVLAGTIFVVAGIFFISWQRESTPASFHRRDFLFPLTASALAGIIHPVIRYALGISNQPLFFAALVGTVSLLGFVSYLALPGTTERLLWKPKAVRPFVTAALFETLAFLLFTASLSRGPVVLVSPIIATVPMWVLLGASVLFRGLESISYRTVFGTCLVVAGTIAISVGG